MKKRCLLVLLFTLATAFPAQAAGPGETAASEATQTEAAVNDSSRSRVITVGGGETTVSTDPVSEAQASETQDSEQGRKGRSLGMFTTTGYCNCTACSSGHNLTYSGTVPKASHTISADLSLYPIGTKLMIDDIIYTVEDMGSSVNGKWIDIYYDNHDAAVAHGMKSQEVFAVDL
ncbi:MAG: 3D domain-containing protein [Lachnospiraceae bacterium]|nr:3D domain-containing protein [Lachnospiraceae bacterium]